MKFNAIVSIIILDDNGALVGSAATTIEKVITPVDNETEQDVREYVRDECSMLLSAATHCIEESWD